MKAPKLMRFRINPSIIEIEYVRCRSCKSVIMLVIHPQKNEDYCWVHVLFPGEEISCKNPGPDREKLNGP